MEAPVYPQQTHDAEQITVPPPKILQTAVLALHAAASAVFAAQALCASVSV
jgi:hypothetical protein